MESSINEQFFRISEIFRDRLPYTETAQRIACLLFIEWFVSQNKDSYDANGVWLKPQVSLDKVEGAIQSYVSRGPHIITDLRFLCQTLEDAFPEELGNVLSTLGFKHDEISNEWNERVKSASITLRNTLSDNIPEMKTQIFDAYLRLISDALASGYNAPGFETPSAVCTLIANIVQTQPKHIIYDPSAGSGQLLLACASTRSVTNEVLVSGYEINSTAWALAKVNLIVHGYPSREVLLGNSLVNHFHGHRSPITEADIVVSNPPWGLNTTRVSDENLQSEFGIPPKNNADYAFILHMISRLRKSSGRMAVIVSSGALFRQGAEALIRKNLCENKLVDAVIALPERLFQRTSVAVSILLINYKEVEDRSVLFIDARGMAQASKRGNYLTADTVDKITNIYFDRTEEEGISRNVGIDELSENDFSLHVPRYVHPVVLCDKTTLADVIFKRRKLEKDLTALDEKIESELKMLNLLTGS